RGGWFEIASLEQAVRLAGVMGDSVRVQLMDEGGEALVHGKELLAFLATSNVITCCRPLGSRRREDHRTLSTRQSPCPSPPIDGRRRQPRIRDPPPPQCPDGRCAEEHRDLE